MLVCGAEERRVSVGVVVGGGESGMNVDGKGRGEWGGVRGLRRLRDIPPPPLPW